MPDSRFYEALGPFSLAELARIADATLADPAHGDRAIASVAPLAHADPEAISFLSDKRYLPDLRVTRAGACVIAPAYAADLPAGCAALVTPEPQVGYARIATRLHRPRRHVAGTPVIHPDALLEPEVELGPGVVIGPGVKIGSGTEVGANTVIGPGVTIGREARIGANVAIGFALIGDRVRILSGAVIGEAGFGVAGGRAGAIDVPQLGRVILQDDVSVGACTCIDRGAWDDTVVGENTKIDNLVQVAHNVRLGRNCVLAGHVGLSGSVQVGDGAMFGGRAGIADHLKIGAGAKIAAAAGVMHDIPAGEVWCGVPARPLRRFMRETAWLARQAKAREGNEAE